MHIREIMTPDPVTVTPNKTLREVSKITKTSAIGMLPVGENDRLVGTITGRDIVIRALADGRGPEATVGEVLSTTLRYCFDDEEVSAVADNLGEEQLRRLPVLDRDKQLVGIVSLGDIVQREDLQVSGQTLSDIVQDKGTAG